MPKARAYSSDSAAMSDNPPEAIAKGNILFYKSNATQKEKRKKRTRWNSYRKTKIPRES